MSNSLKVIVATMRGGPVDGERRTVPDQEPTLIYKGIDPEQQQFLATGDISRCGETIRFLEYRYRRTDDWLRDGSVVFEYEPLRELPA